MARVCQTSPGLGPRRVDRAIRRPMMIRASTPSKIHSHRSDDAVLLLAVASGLAAAAGLCPAGRLTLGTAVLMALLMVPPHPVTRTPTARAAPVRTRHLIRSRRPAARASLREKCPASTRQA